MNAPILPVPAAVSSEASAKEEPRPGRYRHYKGNEYRVLGLARHSETLEPLVVYEALYGERGTWVRPTAMFGENVTLADGRRVPRFTFIAAD